MQWADVLANELLKKKTKHVLASGITPSGPIHIGNMREILTTDAVYRCLIENGGDAEFIYICDDYDPLRKVYPHLPASYEQFVGKPLSEIPCPCGNHKSYADHYLDSFLGSLHEIGVNPHVYRASEMNTKGEYNESIQIALENTNKIRNILETLSGRQMPIFIRSKGPNVLHVFLKKVREDLKKMLRGSGVSLTIDIDPYQML